MERPNGHLQRQFYKAAGAKEYSTQSLSKPQTRIRVKLWRLRVYLKKQSTKVRSCSCPLPLPGLLDRKNDFVFTVRCAVPLRELSTWLEDALQEHARSESGNNSLKGLHENHVRINQKAKWNAAHPSPAIELSSPGRDYFLVLPTDVSRRTKHKSRQAVYERGTYFVLCFELSSDRLFTWKYTFHSSFSSLVLTLPSFRCNQWENQIFAWCANM